MMCKRLLLEVAALHGSFDGEYYKNNFINSWISIQFKLELNVLDRDRDCYTQQRFKIFRFDTFFQITYCVHTFLVR